MALFCQSLKRNMRNRKCFFVIAANGIVYRRLSTTHHMIEKEFIP
jgi:hypothetical protein